MVLFILKTIQILKTVCWNWGLFMLALACKIKDYLQSRYNLPIIYCFSWVQHWVPECRKIMSSLVVHHTETLILLPSTHKTLLHPQIPTNTTQLQILLYRQSYFVSALACKVFFLSSTYFPVQVNLIKAWVVLTMSIEAVAVIWLSPALQSLPANITLLLLLICCC